MMFLMRIFKGFGGAGFFLVRIVAYLAVVLVFGLSLFVIVQRHELKLLTEFQALQRVNPAPRAIELADAGEYCEALEYLDYFREYDYVRNNEEISKLYEEIKEEREAYLFRLKDVWSGVWKGRGACMESLVSATVSDFMVIGDVRDLAWQSLNKYYGRDSDDFTMALAGIGILLTGVTVAATPSTGGVAASPGVAARASVSLLKLAKKMGKLPLSLQRSLVKLARECRRAKTLKPLKPLSMSLYRISKVQGLKIRDFLIVISRCKNVDDVKHMEKVARVFGKRTGKFLALGDDAPVRVLKKFGNSKEISRAVNSAIEFGPDGKRLLVKTGPTKFLRYARITKYSARTVRTIWQNRLTMMLAGLMKLLPEWFVWVIALFSGVITVGVPARYVIRLRRPARSSA